MHAVLGIIFAKTHKAPRRLQVRLIDPTTPIGGSTGPCTRVVTWVSSMRKLKRNVTNVMHKLT